MVDLDHYLDFEQVPRAFSWNAITEDQVGELATAGPARLRLRQSSNLQTSRRT
jgi:hypothetical protein